VVGQNLGYLGYTARRPVPWALVEGSEEAQLESEGDVPSGLLSEGGRCHVSRRVQGWVSEFTSDRARILEPMGRYCWQTWGRVRLYTTLCGHAVHHDCWDAFYASVLQQARHPCTTSSPPDETGHAGPSKSSL
jgi:hypothetical protein